MVKRYRFDAALSFAGPDRKLAQDIARAMQEAGLRVFYDKDHQAHLWGKNRSEYERIYGPDSAYVVAIISKDYGGRDWPQWEFGTAKREANKRTGEFLLAVQVDGARQFGLPDDHNYLSADDFTPEEIASALKAKIDAAAGPNRSATERTAGTSVLTLPARRALGLIITAPTRMTAGHLRSFFPDLDWTKHIRQFRRDRLIQTDGLLIIPAKRTARCFAEELAILEGIWAAKLEELSEHPDCTFFLALFYAKEKRLGDAVRTLGAVAADLEPGWWARQYTTVFDALSKPKTWSKLNAESRLVFHRAYGHCLSASGHYGRARDQFRKLKSAGERANDAVAVGLALLNIGVNYEREGDSRSAERWYEKAREYGNDHGQLTLVSHALNNLGQSKVATDPRLGIKLLKESIEHKEATGDTVGVACSQQALAVAYAELDDFQNAAKHFEHAESIARRV